MKTPMFRVVPDDRPDVEILPRFSWRTADDGVWGVINSDGVFVNPSRFCCKADAKHFARGKRRDQKEE